MSEPAPATRLGTCLVCGVEIEQRDDLGTGLWLPKHCSEACDRITERKGEQRTEYFVEARRAHLQRNALAAANLRPEIAKGQLSLESLPRLYKEAWRGGGVDPARYEEIVGVVRDFVKVPALLRGAGVASVLYLWGDKGLGKTWICEAAVGYAVKEMREGAVFTSHEEMCAEVKRAYSSAPQDRDAVEVRIVEGFTDVPVLSIDDVGRKTSATEWELNLLLRVVDERIRMSRATLVSSNYSVKQLYELWSDADDARKTKLAELLCDRLSDQRRAISLRMSGTSLRREK